MSRLGIISAFALIGLLIVPALVHAEPFVECDPYPAGVDQPTEFRIVLSFSVPAHKLPDGSVTLKLDAASLPDGEYRLDVAAVGADKSESSATSAKLLKTGNDIKVEPIKAEQAKAERVKEKIAPTRVDGQNIKPKSRTRR